MTITYEKLIDAGFSINNAVAVLENDTDDRFEELMMSFDWDFEKEFDFWEGAIDESEELSERAEAKLKEMVRVYRAHHEEQA